MSQPINPLSYGLRAPSKSGLRFFTRQTPWDRVFRFEFYLATVHSPAYLAQMREVVFKDLGRQAGDFYCWQLRQLQHGKGAA